MQQLKGVRTAVQSGLEFVSGIELFHNNTYTHKGFNTDMI